MSLGFSKKMLFWYRKNARDLPWRRTKDPYKIWISEVMLQQTTVNTVIPYYERWIKLFPTVKHVAKTTLEDILRLWQGLGYYSRARNIHKASQIIVKSHSGQIPSDPIAARKLPGFGPYTTGAVLSIAYDIRHPIIDANVRRVIMRLLALKGFADVSQDQKIFKFLDKVLPDKNIGDFNQALMELGALICKSKTPLCLSCPVRSFCKAYQKGMQEIIPQPKKKIIKDIHAAIGIIQNGRRYFIQKRPSKGLLADLWEFPGGKIEKGESAAATIKRELKEELGVELKSLRWLMETKHFYTEFRVHLHVFQCELKKNPVLNRNRRWVDMADFYRYPMPSGSVKIVEALKG